MGGSMAANAVHCGASHTSFHASLTAREQALFQLLAHAHDEGERER